MCVALEGRKSTLISVPRYAKIPQVCVYSNRILKVGAVVTDLVKYPSHSNWPLAERSYGAFDLLITFCCQCKYFSFLAVQEMYIFILLLHIVTDS